MSTLAIEKTTRQEEPPALRKDLAQKRRTLLGSFRDEAGRVHECWLALSKRPGEGLVYELTEQGPAKCLAWVGGPGGDVRAEAEALYELYRGGEVASRNCRMVSRREADALRRKGARR